MRATLLFCLTLSVLVCYVHGAKNYGDALAKSILFYAAQRSGKLPSNNPISWRGDSALNDCVPGGWYDAGDHCKFGTPLASTVNILGWSLLNYKDGYTRAGQLNQMYDMIKWAYDYMLKAWNPSRQELTVQVGDSVADHNWWGRPEDMTMARPCQLATKNYPGSDVAGGFAAALAIGSLVYKDKGDSSYSNQLLSAAKSVYEFGKTYRGEFVSVPSSYFTWEDEDELCTGAMWLYKVTKEAHYLNEAKGFAGWNSNKILGWESQNSACQILLYEATKDNTYKSNVETHFNEWFPGGKTTYTPCGLAWRDKWGANRWAGNTAFLALVAADMGFDPTKYRKWAVEQINYMLGDNKHDGGCYSFEIGYGSKYPKSPHHRAASCPSPPAACYSGPSDPAAALPHLLVGALVGGPDDNDFYEDKWTDYVHNEVAIDYNGGFHAALAGILHLQSKNQFPATQNKCPCNQ